MILQALSSVAHQSGAVSSDSPAFDRPTRTCFKKYRLIKAVESFWVECADDPASEMVDTVWDSPDSGRQFFYFFTKDRTCEC